MKVYYITNGQLLQRYTRREKLTKRIILKARRFLDWFKKYSGILLLSLLCLSIFILGNC